MREVEAAAHLPVTGIVNNSNLGEETTVADVLATVREVERLSAIAGLPVRFTSVEAALAKALEGKIENLFPLSLQEKYYK